MNATSWDSIITWSYVIVVFAWVLGLVAGQVVNKQKIDHLIPPRRRRS